MYKQHMNNPDKRLLRQVIGSLVAISMLSATQVNASSHKEVIEKRQHGFETIDSQNGLLERELNADTVDWQRIRQLAESNQTLSQALFSQFPQGSTDSSRAKEKIWTDWVKFEGLLKQMDQGFTELYQAAGTGQIAAAKQGLEQAKGTCRSCHRVFRSFW